MQVDKDGYIKVVLKGAGILPGFQSAVSVSRQTTTLNFPIDKVSLIVTDPVPGTYYLSWSALVDNNEKPGEYFLWDDTLGQVVGEKIRYTGKDDNDVMSIGTHTIVALASTTTYKIQWNAVTKGDTQGIREARITIWQVA